MDADCRLKPLQTAVIGLAVISCSGIVRGHGTEHILLGGFDIGFVSVITLSVLFCLVSGLMAIYCRTQIEQLLPGPMHSTIAVLLAILGLSLLVPAALQHPTLAGLSALASSLFLGIVMLRSQRLSHHHANLTTGALLSHRSMEGLLLATLYTANVAIGLFGAFVLTVHAMFETVTVSSIYPSQNPIPALGAIILLQVGFVAGAVIGIYTSIAISTSVQNLLLATAGGALLVLGVAEFRS